MIRIFDFVFSFLGLLLLFPVLFILYIVGLFDTGSPMFKQQRMGRKKRPFTLYKFRTMRRDTQDVATHLASKSAVTRYGSFLRKTKLDELPQLWNVLRGDMSLVGPRPNLFNQPELIEERDSRGVYEHVPGITGLAQINEIDMSTPVLLAETDAQMLRELTPGKYFHYIFATIGGKGSGDRIKG